MRASTADVRRRYRRKWGRARIPSESGRGAIEHRGGPRGRPENAPQRVGSAAWAAAEGGLQRTAGVGCGASPLKARLAHSAWAMGGAWALGKPPCRRRDVGRCSWGGAMRQPPAGRHRWKLTSNAAVIARVRSERPH